MEGPFAGAGPLRMGNGMRVNMENKPSSEKPLDVVNARPLKASNRTFNNLPDIARPLDIRCQGKGEFGPSRQCTFRTFRGNVIC